MGEGRRRREAVGERCRGLCSVRRAGEGAAAPGPAGLGAGRAGRHPVSRCPAAPGGAAGAPQGSGLSVGERSLCALPAAGSVRPAPSAAAAALCAPPEPGGAWPNCTASARAGGLLRVSWAREEVLLLKYHQIPECSAEDPIWILDCDGV